VKFQLADMHQDPPEGAVACRILLPSLVVEFRLMLSDSSADALIELE